MLPPDGAGWQRRDRGGTAVVTTIQNTLNHRRAVLDQMWKESFEAAGKGTGLLGHPKYDPGGRSVFIYQKPLFECGTAAYEDVEAMLARIHQSHVVEKGHRKVMVVGDQQTYDRMLRIKTDATVRKTDARDYDWLIVLPGEFHFQWHATLAFHIKWWHYFSAWFCTAAGQDNTVDYGSMQKADKIKYILHFYSLVTLSCVTYLRKVFTQAELDSYDTFVQAHAGNHGE